MITTEFIKSNWLAYAGFILPYVAILIISGIVYLLTHQLIARSWSIIIGAVSLFVPLGISFLGAIMVGINTIKQDKINKTGRSAIQSFFFSFFWAAVYHFFITLYLFMPFVYMSVGMPH